MFELAQCFFDSSFSDVTKRTHYVRPNLYFQFIFHLAIPLLALPLNFLLQK
jgi:hypothetical protein